MLDIKNNFIFYEPYQIEKGFEYFFSLINESNHNIYEKIQKFLLSDNNNIFNFPLPMLAQSTNCICFHYKEEYIIKFSSLNNINNLITKLDFFPKVFFNYISIPISVIIKLKNSFDYNEQKLNCIILQPYIEPIRSEINKIDLNFNNFGLYDNKLFIYDW